MLHLPAIIQHAFIKSHEIVARPGCPQRYDSEEPQGQAHSQQQHSSTHGLVKQQRFADMFDFWNCTSEIKGL